MIDVSAVYLLHGPALSEYIEPVAIIEFLHLGRVPDESSAPLGFAANQFIDLLLGADIDAAHWVIQENDAGVGGESSCEKHFLLISAAEGQDRRIDGWRLHLEACRPLSGEIFRSGARYETVFLQGIKTANRQIIGDRP